MNDEVVRKFVAILAANRIRLFYDPGTEPIWITTTLTADDVILIIRDPKEFEVQQREVSRETYCGSQGQDREGASRGAQGEGAGHASTNPTTMP